MTQPQEIQFGEWLPDQPDSSNPGCLDARNVIPEAEGYRPMASLDRYSFVGVPDLVPVAAYYFEDRLSIPHIYIATPENIADITARATTTLYGVAGVTGVSHWEMTNFGDQLVMVSHQAEMYKKDATDQFMPVLVGGLPPRAKRVAVVQDYVVVGDTELNGGGLGDAVGPNYIQWCGFNNLDQWSPSLTTQADYQQLFVGGRVQRIVPGQYGVIMQEHAIRRMEKVDPPTIFDVTKVIKNETGTPAPGSVVWKDNLVFFYGWDGFRVFNGQESESISNNKINRWFAQKADIGKLDTMRSVIDRKQTLVMWSFRSESAQGSSNDVLLVYNWSVNRWSYGDIVTELLTSIRKEDSFVDSEYLQDELIDGPNGAIQIDAQNFEGQAFSPAFILSDGTIHTQSGPSLTGSIETREVSGPNNHRLFTNSVRPFVEGGPQTSIDVEIGHRNDLQANRMYTARKSTNTINNEVSARVNSRYQTYRVNVSGGFKTATGVRTHSHAMGGRR